VDLSGYDDGAGAMKRMSFLSDCSRTSGDQRGVALIIVLWIFIFLFVVAFDFTADVREEANAALRFKEDTEGYYLAFAGFERGLYEYAMWAQAGQAQETESPAGFFDTTWHEEKLGSGAFRVRLVDEGGKINLNRADEAALRNVFTNLGVDEPRLSVLVDSILDWIDPDDLHRPSGAENEYYELLSSPYSSKNGFFDTVEELLWIKGMTQELFYGSTAEAEGAAPRPALSEIFTVDSPIDRVNLRTASAQVITALLGIPWEKAVAFVQERKKLSNNSIGDLLPLLGIGATDAAMRMFVFTNPSVISVEAEGLTAGVGAPRRLKGVVRVGGGQGQFEMVRWVDRATAPALSYAAIDKTR
jgi:general secretion pathway protein K